MLANLGDVLKGFMVVVDTKLRRPEITAKSFGGPHDTLSSEAKGGPAVFGISGHWCSVAVKEKVASTVDHCVST